MATMRSAWGAAKLIADAMGRTFMEYKTVVIRKDRYRKFREGTVQLRRARHPTKRRYLVVLVGNSAPLGYHNPFGARSFSASELLNLSSVLNTIRVHRAKAEMKKLASHNTMGFLAWKKSGM